MFTIGEKCTLFNMLLNNKKPVKLKIGEKWNKYFSTLENWTSDDILTFQKVDCIFTFDVQLKDITDAEW